MRLSLLRSAAIGVAIMGAGAAAPAYAQWAVIDGTNLVQNTKTAINQVNEAIQQVQNAKRLTNLKPMLNQVSRSATDLINEKTNAISNSIYKTNPNSSTSITTIQNALRAQGAPASQADALNRLTSTLGSSSQSAATLKSYDGMYARADNAANLTRSIADVEQDRASLAQSVNSYAAEGASLGDNNMAASMQHVAAGNLLNARQMNKMIEAQNVVAQQNQDQINRELAQESARLESHIRAIQKAGDAQNVTVSDINASPISN